MSHPGNLRIEDYTYDLPADKIASYPLPQRDASKLLVYKDGVLSESIYRDLAAEIPSGSLLVFNQTKVVHARLLFKKDTGGVIEVFCLEPHSQYPEVQTALQQKHKVWWDCMIGGASKWKHGMSLSIHYEDPNFTLTAIIAERKPSSFTIEFTWDADLNFAEVLQYMGRMPIPPYLHRDADESDEIRYQTIFARNEGSVAAPTAALHFTEHIMQQLSDKQIDSELVTLHVGAGTFKPVKSETMQEHDMHAEWLEVDIPAIENIIAHLDKGIIAVGTTALRTLESLYWIGVKIWNGADVNFNDIAVTQWDPYEIYTTLTAKESFEAILSFLKTKGLSRLVTRTQVMIAPGYEFRVIKGLVTNFHQPQSTLLLLVSALIGNDWKRVYNHALQNGFRFLSYGDGSLLWRS